MFNLNIFILTDMIGKQFLAFYRCTCTCHHKSLILKYCKTSLSLYIPEHYCLLLATSTPLLMIRKKSFVSVAVIKQLQAKQKYGLVFYRPNLHFVKKFCVSSMQFTKFDYESKVGHKYLSACSYGVAAHKKVSERDKSKS